MKPRLLLYLTTETNPARNAIAATLSWACMEAGWFFEIYYDGYRLGEHYGGGNPASLPPGYASGGTTAGAHHHERLYLLLHRFETTVVLDGPVAFAPALAQLDAACIVPALEHTAEDGAAPGLALRTDPLDLYRQVFAVLGVPWPETLAVLDAAPTPPLAGLDAYYYPDVVARHALALEVRDVTPHHLARLQANCGLRAVALLGLGSERAAQVQREVAQCLPGASVESADLLAAGDTFDTVTARIAHRHLATWRGGWVLADPMTVAAWLPEAVRARRLAVYGKPQRLVVQRLAAEIGATSTAVLGRQYEDGDFFDLSSLGVAFQLIDPLRPPFPVLRYAAYQWTSGNVWDAPDRRTGEPDDEQLRRWATEGRVLTSLIFWTGMIRELENLARIVDLVALTRMKGGIALTTEALAYQPEAPLELLRVPLEQGGVFPHLEMLLASCGVGAAIESRLPAGRLAAYLRDAADALDRLGLPPYLRPQGWWSTMDCVMLPLPAPRLPISLAAQRGAPFVKVRYAGGAAQGHGGAVAASGVQATAQAASTEYAAQRAPRQRGVKRRLGDWARSHGLRELLAPYRPYEFYAPGAFPSEIVPALRSAGLSYMFSKAGFGAPPQVLYGDESFVALNYTAGHWDGWTPFETVNSLHDLRSAERRLLARKQPGWLVGTLDTCLWAFTGPIWARGAELRAIGEFLARGGTSGQLLNVTPAVVARYARIVQAERLAGATSSAQPVGASHGAAEEVGSRTLG